MSCYCGETDCPNYDMGYPYCRPHEEHHRPPECPIDTNGVPNPWWEDES